MDFHGVFGGSKLVVFSEEWTTSANHIFLVIQFVTFLGWWISVTLSNGWNRDLQRSGMKRSRLESPGFLARCFCSKIAGPLQVSDVSQMPKNTGYMQDTGYLHNKMHKTMPQIVEIRWSLIHSLSGDTFVTFVGWNDVKTTLKTDSNLRPYHSNWSCLPKNIPLTTDISTLKIDGWFNLIHIQIKKTRYLCF